MVNYFSSSSIFLHFVFKNRISLNCVTSLVVVFLFSTLFLSSFLNKVAMVDIRLDLWVLPWDLPEQTAVHTQNPFVSRQ